MRTVPRSRRNPQYNTDTLPAALHGHGLGYEHLAPLGGLRSRVKGVPPEVNAFWQNQSFHNYADYAMGPAFAAGLARLIEIGEETPCAVMCAEALWWRCHRRIITDYLLAAGKPVWHILASGEAKPAEITAAARPAPGGVLNYPAGDLLG